MPFTVRTLPVSAAGKPDTAYVLSDVADTVRAEVWPGFGFNCLRWQLRQPDGSWGNVLFTAPDWEANPVPTRSGHPVLFPFPNRLAHGRFTFDGKEYQLPLNESSGTHAIHGFTPRTAWRVVGAGGEKNHAFVSGQLQLSNDLPGATWPGEFVLTITYALHANALVVDCLVDNPGPGPLPFGLGYHPYFAMPDVTDAMADDMVLEAATGELWETDGGIPTGRRLPVPAELDFRSGRAIRGTALDTLYSTATPSSGSRLTKFAKLTHPRSAGALHMFTAADFRELVLFTPPHRKAVAIEPYTCATNAASLPDGGWRVLGPGDQWAAGVRYEWRSGK
jgi:aldose 1-epimerase